jgi:hypothetical protein
MCLDFEGPEGFICDACVEANAEPKRVCGGQYVGDGVRVEIATRKPIVHDLTKHGAEDLEQHTRHGGQIQ